MVKKLPVTKKKTMKKKKEKEWVQIIENEDGSTSAVFDLDSEKEDKPSEKKLPNKPIVKLEIGTIELGTDNKTKYSVQLNKVGRKYWKRV